MSAITNTTTSNPVSTGDAFSSLSSDEFLQIIFTELQNQDPLEPQDTGAMIDQLSGLRAIESDEQMVNSLSQLVAQNQFSAASGLIGSLVSGISISNQRVADLVISVSQTDQGPVLNLFSGQRMFFDQVDEVVGPIDEGEETPDDDSNDEPVGGVDDDSSDDGTTDGVDDGSDDSVDGTPDDGTDDSSDDNADEPTP
jgi:flagellar basal-body rod modification protein FlgD